MHTAGDLSAKNIFLSAAGCDGDIRVGDFGVAKALSLTHSAALTSTLAGTPYYWSPEVLSRRPYGLEADVWSVGVVAFELLTLRRPFTASSLDTLAQLVTGGAAAAAFAQNDEALRACAHPPTLWRLATSQALLHPEPARRLQLAAAVAACAEYELGEAAASSSIAESRVSHASATCGGGAELQESQETVSLSLSLDSSSASSAQSLTHSQQNQRLVSSTDSSTQGLAHSNLSDSRCSPVGPTEAGPSDDYGETVRRRHAKRVL